MHDDLRKSVSNEMLEHSLFAAFNSPDGRAHAACGREGAGGGGQQRALLLMSNCLDSVRLVGYSWGPAF